LQFLTIQILLFSCRFPVVLCPPSTSPYLCHTYETPLMTIYILKATFYTADMRTGRKCVNQYVRVPRTNQYVKKRVCFERVTFMATVAHYISSPWNTIHFHKLTTTQLAKKFQRLSLNPKANHSFTGFRNNYVTPPTTNKHVSRQPPLITKCHATHHQ